MGLQKQVLANGLQTLWNIVKPIGAIIILQFVSLNLTSFFMWQIACNIFYLILLRYCIFKNFENAQNLKPFAIKELPPDILKYLGGMVIISLLSAANIQIDKLMTSKVFRLEEFGYYYNATILSQIPVLIATAIAVAIFPMMTKLISENNRNELLNVFKNYFLH